MSLPTICVVGTLVYMIFFSDTTIVKSMEYRSTIDSLRNEINIQTDSLEYYRQLNDRLQRDPQYFYRTLPYAEAMGLGAQFARKFGDTELEPCEWYHEPNLPRTASGFYDKLQETLALLDFSIRY